MPEESSQPDAPKSTEPKGPRKVTSLTEIVEAAQKSPPRTDPIVLEWFLPPTPDNKEGDYLSLEIETRFSADPWLFGIKYMTTVQEERREQKANEKGEMVHVSPDADMIALAREVVVKPTWLHNKDAMAKLKANMPPPTFAELRRKLMITAGLDGDFFGDYPQLTMPKTFRLSASVSVKGSDNPLGQPTPSDPGNSSPSSSTTGSAVPKTAEPASATISGS